MKIGKWRVAGAALLGCLALAPTAKAEAGSTLGEVQKAYSEVDYERTRQLASAAVRSGHLDRVPTGKLYLLWAIAAAALGDSDEARTAFSYAIAANPDLKLDRSLSPKMRAPYLEARGALPEADGPALDVRLRRRKQDIDLALHDALGVAASVVVSTRAKAGGSFTQRRFDAAPTLRVPMPNGSEFDFFLQVLDRYENVLFSLGTAQEPERLVKADSDKPSLPAPSGGKATSPLPYYITSGALAVLGAAAGGAATLMFVRREDAAREWNGAPCEKPGLTRAEQCQEVDDRRQLAERMSIGFAAAGGALLVGSVVSLVLAPSASRPSVSLNAGPGSVLLRWQTAL